MPFNPRTLLQRLRILVAVMVARLVSTGPYTDRVSKQQFWLINGQLLPAMAGGAPDDDDDDGDDTGDGDDENDDDDGDDDNDDADADDELDEDTLSDKVKDILRKNRKTARDAQRRAKTAERKLAAATKKKPAAKKEESKDEEQDTPHPGEQKLRKANLLVALTSKVGDRAKAVARLIDVDYDDNDEPIDLDDAIQAAIDEFGETVVRGEKPRKKAPRTNGGDNDKDREGPKLTADELKAAKAAGMTPEEYAIYKSPQPVLPDDKTKE